jgi:signal transduction histidine kinase
MAAHAKARVFVDNIKVAADRVLKMVAELLDVARIEAGRVKLEIVTFELAPVIAESTALLQGMSEERNTPLMVYMEDVSCVVRADRLRTSQVLLNLVSNALKYGEVDSQVMISVSSTKDAITVEVSDRGAGLSEAELGALFQPYSRPMRRSCEIEGTGLGLVVTRQLVELMGGGIEVHSEPGVGSVFAFTLPAA